MDNWFSKLTTFLVELIKNLLLGFLELLKDIALWFLEGILHAVSLLLYLIPEPCCVPVNWIGELVGKMPPFAIFVVGHIDFQAALTILACGVAFYMLRKLFTLGQW